ncbi:MAG: hypothetical protein JW809_04430 [Pirellulales bacterium]|nr:hypothetical protein [Pirellulales bacterium]
MYLRLSGWADVRVPRALPVLVMVALLLAAPAVRADTCPLTLKKIVPAKQPVEWPVAIETAFANVEPQSFEFSWEGGKPILAAPTGQTPPPAFSEVIKKELPGYAARHPLRAVAKLGSDYYGFVLDAAAPTPEEREAEADARRGGPLARALGMVVRKITGNETPRKDYTRLVFDQNRNGDLTDDPVVEMIKEEEGEDGSSKRARYRIFYDVWRPSTPDAFPRIDLPINVDGMTIDYAFVVSQSSGWRGDTTVELRAAVYADGELTVDGRRRRVVVVDGNSNGRFDDAPRVLPPDADNEDPRAAAQIAPGDVLYVLDPRRKHVNGDLPDGSDGAPACRYHVGPVIFRDGRFFDLTVLPAGDRLSLAPSTAPVGHVLSAHRGYRGLVAGPQGVLPIIGDIEGKAPLPEGEWKLLNYTIEPDRAADAGRRFQSSRSLALAIGRAVLPGLVKDDNERTVAMADVPARVAPVKVAAGHRVPLPFGPPYLPVVKVSSPLEDGEVTLELELVGTAGELCEYLLVEGDRPGQPKFTITAEDGKVVKTGQFEYG